MKIVELKLLGKVLTKCLPSSKTEKTHRVCPIINNRLPKRNSRCHSTLTLKACKILSNTPPPPSDGRGRCGVEKRELITFMDLYPQMKEKFSKTKLNKFGYFLLVRVTGLYLIMKYRLAYQWWTSGCYISKMCSFIVISWEDDILHKFRVTNDNEQFWQIIKVMP